MRRDTALASFPQAGFDHSRSLPVSIAFGTLVGVALFCPVETLITATIWSGSNLSLAPSTRASKTVAVTVS